jgi:hypothetical protein
MFHLAAVVAILVAGPAVGAAAQESDGDGPPECGTYQGVVCRGWFTDDAGVVDDDQEVEDAIDRVAGRYGVQIAFVFVDDTGDQTPEEFAAGIGDAWRVGDPERNDGIVVVVDLAGRETSVEPGSGIAIDSSRAAGAGNSFFGVGEFATGALAIVGSLEQEIAAALGGDGGGTGSPDEPATSGSGDDDPSGWLVLGGFGVAAAAGGGIGLGMARRKRHTRVQTARQEKIDGDLARLEPAGAELPLMADYQVPFDGDAASTGTAEALAALRAVADGRAPDPAALDAVWAEGLVVIVDLARLQADTEEPLELRASGERALLENAVQQAAHDAAAVDADDEARFDVARAELVRLVESLRPHRVAAARRRLADTIAARLTATDGGPALLSDAGERFLESAPALDPAAALTASLGETQAAYATAAAKTDRLEHLYAKLPMSTTRPAVAAALADLDDDLDEAYADYEQVRSRLEQEGSSLSADGLDVPAIAALLVLNNDDADVAEFLDAYQANRGRGSKPDEAVEYALAGLRDRGEVERVRAEADRLGLPVSIMTALLRRRDDGPEVYQEMLDRLVAEGVTGDTRRTIAGILAISLEPAQAMRRWLEARLALVALGLTGAYADVAAAFGASDPRGPRVFALAYAAQRQALARSTIEDADRFAPELAHEGTRRREDSWTGSSIPQGLFTFDPYTLLFYHWIITRGHHGTLGWEPIYRDPSWGGERGSWWSGTGGFGGWGGGGGFGGGGGGGSSWGGSWGGGGGFGGWGGGGGFGGGGGGGSSW